MRRHLVDTLYTDAMLIADEARDYFDRVGKIERDGLDPLLRIGFACEAMKVTTRLMLVIAWLLTRRAVDAGELTEEQAFHPARRLGAEPVPDAEVVARMPAEAQRLMTESIALYRRAAVHDAAIGAAIAGATPTSSPVHAIHAQIAARL